MTADGGYRDNLLVEMLAWTNIKPEDRRYVWAYAFRPEVLIMKSIVLGVSPLEG